MTDPKPDRAATCWSYDQEIYSTCFDDVCRSAFDIADPDASVVTIYEADVRRPSAADFLISADEIIERAMENAGERYGESAEDWLQNVTLEQEAILSEAFKAAFEKWVDETGNSPRFFEVENVRELKVRCIDDSNFEIVNE